MIKIFIAGLAMTLSACTGNVIERFPLEPAPNECQVTEARPTSLSTLAFVVCWDYRGRPIGLAGGSGAPAIGPPLSILGAGAIVGGAYVLGSEISGWTVNTGR